MENVKYSLFDLFSFTIPGALTFISYLILLSPYSVCACPNEVINVLFKDANIYLAFFYILMSYVIGYITSSMSSVLWWINDKLYYKQVKYKSTLRTSEKYSLVREFSKENFKYIELWNVLAKMASNLSLTILLIFILFFIKIDCFKWWYLILGILISISVFLQARNYKIWAQIDLDNTVSILKLEENVIELIKKEKK